MFRSLPQSCTPKAQKSPWVNYFLTMRDWNDLGYGNSDLHRSARPQLYSHSTKGAGLILCLHYRQKQPRPEAHLQRQLHVSCWIWESISDAQLFLSLWNLSHHVTELGHNITPSAMRNKALPESREPSDTQKWIYYHEFVPEVPSISISSCGRWGRRACLLKQLTWNGSGS